MNQNSMNKRGQVTIFIIVGLVALIAIVLILFLRNQMGIFIPAQSYLTGVSENIQEHISGCVDKYSKDGLKLMMDQGGKIQPVNYKLYEGMKVSYLCNDIPNDFRCLNVLEPLSSWQDDFANYLKLNLLQCINIESFKSNLGGYEIKDEGYDINTKFMNDNVVVEVKPKITITKNENNLKVGNVLRTYDTPLGTIHNVVYNAVNSHATTGSFANLQYTLSMRGSYEIFVEDRPYPDLIYFVQKKDANDKFYFAIQGGEDESL